jgi:hypothetical protein
MTNKASITWIAHYLYAGDAGETKTVIREIDAETYHDAYFLASKLAPAAEFVLSVRAKSDEQVLGSVRYSVDRMKNDD